VDEGAMKGEELLSILAAAAGQSKTAGTFLSSFFDHFLL
jgi:hypothetical protein